MEPRANARSNEASEQVPLVLRSVRSRTRVRRLERGGRCAHRVQGARCDSATRTGGRRTLLSRCCRRQTRSFCGGVSAETGDAACSVLGGRQLREAVAMRSRYGRCGEVARPHSHFRPLIIQTNPTPSHASLRVGVVTTKSLCVNKIKNTSCTRGETYHVGGGRGSAGAEPTSHQPRVFNADVLHAARPIYY